MPGSLRSSNARWSSRGRSVEERLAELQARVSGKPDKIARSSQAGGPQAELLEAQRELEALQKLVKPQGRGSQCHFGKSPGMPTNFSINPDLRNNDGIQRYRMGHERPGVTACASARTFHQLIFGFHLWTGSEDAVPRGQNAGVAATRCMLLAAAAAAACASRTNFFHQLIFGFHAGGIPG